VIEMWIALRETRNQFGLYHPPAPKGAAEANR
jgi:hypothetical protein